MKQVVLEFDDEEMELLEEQFKQIQDVAGMETIEDYIYYATMSHCKTMQAASKMFGQSGDIEKLMADENVHVGVVNMPIQLSNVEDKDEFSRYLNDVLNEIYLTDNTYIKISRTKITLCLGEYHKIYHNNINERIICNDIVFQFLENKKEC